MPGQGYSENQGNLLGLSLGTAGAIGAGFIPTANGRIWDKYLSGIRAIEAGSPGGVLRTFRMSEFLSPLASWGTVATSAQDIAHGKYGKFIESSFGQSGSYNLHRTGQVFGEVRDASGKILGMGLQIESGTQKGAAIVDFAARAEGIQLGKFESLNDAILRNKWQTSKSPLPYQDWLKTIEPHLRRQRMIVGSKIREKIRIAGQDINLSESMAKNVAKAETLGKLLRAKAASTASRLNILLRAPVELPGIKNIAEKIPGMRTLAVKPGSSLELLQRYAVKGMLVGAAWKGLEYTDYLRSEGSPWAGVLATVGGAGTGALLARQPGMKFSKAGMIAGAAVGLATSLSPRFDEGLFYGAASIGADASVAKAQLSQSMGFTDTIREQEQITPGFMDVKTALGFGGTGALIAGLGSYAYFMGESVKEKIGTKTPLYATFESVRERSASRLSDKIWKSKIGKEIGKLPGGRALTKIKSPMALGLLGGITAWAGIAGSLGLLSGNPMAPVAGILGSEETPEELQDIYSGRKEVAIRKGRWWEFGRSTAFEGGRVDYYRPHMLARLKSRAYQKGMYGTEEEKWEYDPLLNPMKALFGSDDWKYHYEKKYQYERPAPTTGTYGEEIPFIGPLVASTFGKLFKPRKLVREEEWNLGGGMYVHHPDIRGETEPSYALGGLGPGAPVAKEDASQLLNELNYKRREAVGLMGFVEGALTKAAIGREEFLQNKQTLGAMGKETGSEYWLWKHMNLGGGAGTTEAVRRFLPRTRSYLDEYNPLRNAMPSWMPEDYFLDLRTGNPFQKVPEAELRLPGEGYAALHPEVSGLSAEEYPLAHKVKILGDVAMWSSEYRIALAHAKRNMNNMTQQEVAMVQETEKQVKERKKRRGFQDYVFSGNQLESYDATVTGVISPKRIMTKEFGEMAVDVQGIGAIKDTAAALQFAQETLIGKTVELKTPTLESRRIRMSSTGPVMKAVPVVGGVDFGQLLAEEGLATQKDLEDEFKQVRFSDNEQLAGKLSEYVLHGIESPIEYLTPMAPVSKLIRQRSAIEEYVASEAIGTSSSFWDKPIQNFLKPALNIAAYKAGSTDIPDEIQERRDIQEHFDMLKWVKASRNEAKARQMGDLSAAARYRSTKEKTLFGMDVFKSPVNIMRALPRRERDFFGEFSDAKTEEERAQILQLIPENEKRVYLSQWMRQEESAAYAKRSAKVDTNQDDKVIATAALMRRSEGFSYTPDQEEQWQNETSGQVEFDDWLREQKAAEYFGSHSLPGADWLGWCLPANQEVLISDYTFSHACDIKPGDKVVTLQGENIVKEVFKREIKEAIRTLTVCHNSVYCMSATNNHLVLGIETKPCKYNLTPNSVCTHESNSWKCQFCTTKYYQSYSARWMPIGEVTTDIYLPIPLLKHADTDPTIDIGSLDCFPKNTIVSDDCLRPKSGRIKPVNRFITLNESVCWLIGYYLAEGNVWAVGDRMRGVQFTANVNEVSILELAQKIIKEHFGLNSEIRYKKNPKSKSAYLQVASSIFGLLIDYWVGRFCDKKFAPSWLQDITYNSQVALLDGLNTGDASKDHRNRLALTNRGLCAMAKRLYEAQGIPASLHGPKKIENRKDQYVVEPLRKSLSAFVGSNFIAYRIKDIEETEYQGTVFDFEVEQNHMYCSPIGIYHNSPSVDLEDVKLQYVEQAGLDHHDFDLWGQRKRALARKPYINPSLIGEMEDAARYEDSWKVAQNSKSLAGMYSQHKAEVYISQIEADLQNDKYNVQIQDGRKQMIESAYRQMGV